MRLVLLGRGRMGTNVEKQSRFAGHEVVLQLDIDSNRDASGLTPDAVAGVDVVIDFTWPESVMGNIHRVAELGLPMVVGTTGWHHQLDDAQEIISRFGTGLVYGANFSIGANLLKNLVAHAARLFDRFAEYDPYVFEHHHRGKLDAPSGTALDLAKTLVASMERKTRVQAGNPDGAIAPDAVHVASLRAGAAFGVHKVGFDCPADTVELILTARGREGFARGALYAAEWIRSRKGFFEFSECLGL